MLLCAWGSTHLQNEPEVRTVMFASGTILAYTLNAFVPIAVYPASEAPHWHIGAKLYMGFAVTTAFVFVGIHFAFRWDEKRKDISTPKQSINSPQVVPLTLAVPEVRATGN